MKTLTFNGIPIEFQTPEQRDSSVLRVGPDGLIFIEKSTTAQSKPPSPPPHHKFIVGDCLELMRAMKTNSVDLAATALRKLGLIEPRSPIRPTDLMWPHALMEEDKR